MTELVRRCYNVLQNKMEVYAQEWRKDIKFREAATKILPRGMGKETLETEHQFKYPVNRYMEMSGRMAALLRLSGWMANSLDEVNQQLTFQKDGLKYQKEYLEKACAYIATQEAIGDQADDEERHWSEGYNYTRKLVAGDLEAMIDKEYKWATKRFDEQREEYEEMLTRDVN